MKTAPAPPRLLLRFFRWFCRPRLRDHIEGDLVELFHERVTKKGRWKARLLFAIDVLLLFRPGIVGLPKLSKPVQQNYYGLAKNNFTTSWRRLLRYRGYSLINIGGLAAGITVTLFISLWIHDELSYNKYHKNYESIAQVWSGGTNPQTSVIGGGYNLQYPVGTVLRKNFPHYFKHVLLFWRVDNHTLSITGNKYSRKGLFIEAGGPEMLSLRFLQGNYNCLKEPNSIILSKSIAAALFGNSNPMNKVIRIDNRMEAKVTGVYDDIPHNSRFGEVQFFAPWNLWVTANEWIKERANDWDNSPFQMLVQLQPNVSMETANAAIKDLYYKNVPADFFTTMDEGKPFVQLIPMKTWHLYSEIREGKPADGQIVFVWLFGLTGIFVLLLACINFINLSTARAEKRAKEVGVRKSIGAGKKQLVFQFLSESYLLVLLSFLVSIGLVILFRNWFNHLAGKEIALPFGYAIFWLLAFGFILLTGFLAGIYPAYFLSSFRPVKVLKGMSRTGRASALPRKVLVAVQFTVSVVLIIGTLVVYQQVRYAQNRPTGYNNNNLITVRVNDPGFDGKDELLKTELQRTGVVTAVSASSSKLTSIGSVTGGYNWKGKDPNLDASFALARITHDFGRTIGWEMKAGRDFSTSFSTDSAESVIVNESAVQYMGLKDPVGEKLIDVDEFGSFKRQWTIIGVVKDIVMGSPYQDVRPTIFYFNNVAPDQMHIRINPATGTAHALATIQSVFEQLNPAGLFEYQFVDEEYALKFTAEQRVGKLALIFAVLAIFISCLGLSGLASYMAEQRTKEIGIRKVMGASVSGLWQLLSKDFVVVVFIACLAAAPVSYFLMKGWLQKYQYHTDIPWWIFLATSFGAVIITILTVSYQSIKAALLNPVKSLRSE